METMEMTDLEFSEENLRRLNWLAENVAAGDYSQVIARAVTDIYEAYNCLRLDGCEDGWWTLTIDDEIAACSGLVIQALPGEARAELFDGNMPIGAAAGAFLITLPRLIEEGIEDQILFPSSSENDG